MRPAVEPNAEAAAYQRRIYGDSEPLLRPEPETWADGFTGDYGAVGDAKLVVKERSWYNPASLGDDFLAERATREMDYRLLKYKAVLADSTNPAQVLEIVTNDPAAASFVEGRMRALGVRSYVRLEPRVP